MSEPLLQNKVVLIVGAGRPPAPALALALAGQGAIIAGNDLSPVLLDPLAEAVCQRGGRIQTYVADATRGMPLRAMLDEILEDWGRIDILINNPRVQPDTPLINIDEWDWQRTVEVNLNGPFLVMQLVARLMREQGGGVILNLVEACQSDTEMLGRAAYVASQQGLLALSQAAAHEFIAYNIRVYTLCSGELLLKDPTRPIAAQTLQPISHDPQPGATLTGLAVFLCGPQAAHLPGQVYRLTEMPPDGTSQQE